MKLSKNDDKFRKRFIAEHHYRKNEQRIFDDAIKELKKTYKEVYKSVKNGSSYMFMVVIAASRTAAAMRRSALSIDEAATAMLNLSRHLEEITNEQS